MKPILLLFTTIYMNSCVTYNPGHISAARVDRFHRMLEKIDKQFAVNFPGSEVREYIDGSGIPTIVSIVNVFNLTCRCAPLNSRAFDSLPTTWENRDPHLDRASFEVAEYVENILQLPPNAELIIRLDKNSYKQSYISLYRVIEQSQYWNGVGPYINFVSGRYESYDYLQLIKAELIR
jgi:hypothetical protein